MTEDYDLEQEDLDDLMKELKALTESDLSTPSQVKEAEKLLKEVKDQLDERD